MLVGLLKFDFRKFFKIQVIIVYFIVTTSDIIVVGKFFENQK